MNRAPQALCPPLAPALSYFVKATALQTRYTLRPQANEARRALLPADENQTNEKFELACQPPEERAQAVACTRTQILILIYSE
jgi:hypothetical protein